MRDPAVVRRWLIEVLAEYETAWLSRFVSRTYTFRVVACDRDEALHVAQERHPEWKGLLWMVSEVP